MKYFEIKDSPELKYATKLKNWYGKFDVRNINPLGYPKLPEKELFFIEKSEKVIFTDFILFPFLLISPLVREVIQMYKEVCFYREIILLDQQSGLSKIYYLPVLDETKSIQLVEKQCKNEVCQLKFEPANNREVFIDRNLFWVRDAKKRHTIISLDMAESLIRRNVIGLGLQNLDLNKDGIISKKEAVQVVIDRRSEYI